jgi:hypothetical protein
VSPSLEDQDSVPAVSGSIGSDLVPIAPPRQWAGLVVVAAALVFLGANLLLWGQHDYPLVGGDAAWMLPPALSWSQNHELRYHPSETAPGVGPQGDRRMIYHGFLQQVVLGTLAPSSTHHGVRQALTWILILTLVAVAPLFWFSARAWPSLARGLITSAALFGLATFVIGILGRSESLPMLLMAACASLLLITPASRQWALAGVAIGLIAAAHPLAGAMSGMLAGAYFSARMPPKRAIAYTVGAAGLSFLVFAATFLIYPYGVHEWLAGSLKYGRLSVVPQRDTSWVWYWLIRPRNTGYGLVFAVVAVGGVWRLWRERSSLRSPLGVALFLGLFALACHAFVWRVHARNYNLFVFSPLAFAALLYLAPPPREGDQAWRRWGSGLGVVGICVMASAGFCRLVLLFPVAARDGVSYVQAREQLRTVAELGSLTVSSGLFALFESPEVNVVDNLREARTDYLALPQAGRGVLEPPEVPGYTLIENQFSPARPTLLGVFLGNTLGMYDYALYRRSRADERPR